MLRGGRISVATVAAALGVASAAFGASPGLSISTSDADPWATTAPPSAGARTLYVWLHATAPDSVLGLDVILAPAGALDFVAFRVTPPFENYGSAWGPLHLHCWSYPANACQATPIVAAEIDVTDNGGRLCLVEYSSSTCVKACTSSDLMYYVGFASDGAAPCSLTDHFGCGSWPAVEGSTWGRSKAAYRRPN